MHTLNYPTRFKTVFIVLIVCLVAFTVKLSFLQLFKATPLLSLAKKQHHSMVELEPKRGTIFDRNMRPLALNIAVYSLFAKPKTMSEQSKQLAVEHLPKLLNVPEDLIKDKLNREKYFIWIARKIPSDIVDQIKSLKIDGLDFRKESKRYYPNQYLAAHLIGFAGIDNKGLEGLELKYDSYLKGEFGWSQIVRDAKQRELLIERNYSPPRDGFNLVLTIDETIQFIAEQALQKVFETKKAIGATIIVMDPKTGEVLALANRPTYDLGKASASLPEQRVNRAIVYTYEPGSVFKIVVASAALEEKLVMESDEFFCENGKYRVGNHILKDHHPHGTLTFQGVVEQSSNIGMAKIAKMLGPPKVYDYIRKFRFGTLTEVNLAGENKGNIKPVSQWSKTSMAAIPMGQEVTVTPLQLVAAISTIANGGVYMQPYVVKAIKDSQDQIIKDFQPKQVSRVISLSIANRMKAILTGVVDNGTGKRAKIEGIKVAGKTGTAQKVVAGTYSHSKYYATFFGFAPADNPKLAAVVVFDEPYPDYFGGTVSAPVFKEVIENSLKYLASK